jgi:site-specific DNA-methyltransferase (adenine-specific)
MGERVTRKHGTSTSSFGTNGRINHDSSKFYNSKLYSGITIKEVEDKTENVLPDKIVNTFILGSSENMKELPDNSIHLMITSPPYNASKEYDEDLSLEEYLTLLENVFKETYRVLVNGGRACINVANLGRKPYIPLSDYISKMMIDIGFNMRGEIIWNKGTSASSSTAWGSWQSATNPILRDIHEYILIFSKGDYNREKGKKSRYDYKGTIFGVDKIRLDHQCRKRKESWASCSFSRRTALQADSTLFLQRRCCARPFYGQWNNSNRRN